MRCRSRGGSALGSFPPTPPLWLEGGGGGGGLVRTGWWFRLSDWSIL